MRTTTATITFRPYLAERSQYAGSWGMRAAICFLARHAKAQGYPLLEGEKITATNNDLRPWIWCFMVEGRSWVVDLERANVSAPDGVQMRRS